MGGRVEKGTLVLRNWLFSVGATVLLGDLGFAELPQGLAQRGNKDGSTTLELALLDEQVNRLHEVVWYTQSYLLCHAYSIAYRQAGAGSASSTWSACVSGFTLRITLATFPSASMTKVERSMPIYVLPYAERSPQTP